MWWFAKETDSVGKQAGVPCPASVLRPGEAHLLTVVVTAIQCSLFCAEGPSLLVTVSQQLPESSASTQTVG